MLFECVCGDMKTIKYEEKRLRVSFGTNKSIDALKRLLGLAHRWPISGCKALLISA
jgi:hypothetical protein